VLLRRLNGEAEDEAYHELLPCTLQVRGTTGPPPG